MRRGAPLVTLDNREIEANRLRAAATFASAVEAARAAESDLASAQAAAARNFCRANDGTPPPGYFVVGGAGARGPKQ